MNRQKYIIAVTVLSLLGAASTAMAKDHGRTGGKFAASASHSRTAHRQYGRHDGQKSRGGRYRHERNYSGGHRATPRGRYRNNRAWHATRYRRHARPYPGHRYGWAYPTHRPYTYRPYRGRYPGYGTGVSVWIDGLGFSWYEYGY
jgi:hypothetical protein